MAKKQNPNNTKKISKKKVEDLKKRLENEQKPFIHQYPIKNLNEKEENYFRQMASKEGVLFIMSEPGLAKSAMMRSISSKLNLHYIDLRLSMMDETDVGLFPDKDEIEVEINGVVRTEKFLSHIIPEWAWSANNPPNNKIGTLIHFEELNRAPLSVRNASLQILLERTIGFRGFKFNENVFMVSSGNLGDEDGTDVEEFDAALYGRLIVQRHTLSLPDWRKYYGDEHVHSAIVSFLNANPEYFYVKRSEKDENEKVYASPRSWTFLSKMIDANYGKEASPQLFLDFVARVGHGYVGAACQPFLRYCRDIDKITIQDILDKYSQYQDEGKVFIRDKRSELLQKLRKVKVAKLKPIQIENAKLFLLDIRADEVAAFIIDMLDNDLIYHKDPTLDDQDILDFLRDPRFEKFNDLIYENVDDDDEFLNINKD